MKREDIPFSILRKLEEVLSEYIENKDEHLVLGENSITIDPKVEDLISLILFNNLS